MQESLLRLDLGQVDLYALVCFVCCWFGYTFYAAWQADKRPCLRMALHQRRREWMNMMLHRDNRITDASLIANIERNVSFFASSTLLIIAGTLTALGNAEALHQAAFDIPWVVDATARQLTIKLVFLAGIMVYAFFKFTWALRQYGFVCIMIGACPSAKSVAAGDDCDGIVSAHIEESANVLTRAAHAFNLGLRSYYFALAFLGWFCHPYLLIVASLWVVGVLYRREFKSRVLAAIYSE